MQNIKRIKTVNIFEKEKKYILLTYGVIKKHIFNVIK